MILQYGRNMLLIFGVVSLVALNSAFSLKSPLEKAESETGFLSFGTEHILSDNNGVKQNNLEEAGNSLSEEGTEESSPTLHGRCLVDSVDLTRDDMHYTVFIADGVRVTVISPRRKQNIKIKGKRVFVNGRLACPNVDMLTGKEVTYQKRRDGSMWHTNLRLGAPMTEKEIQKFTEEEAKFERERFGGEGEEDVTVYEEPQDQKTSEEREKAAEELRARLTLTRDNKDLQICEIIPEQERTERDAVVPQNPGPLGYLPKESYRALKPFSGPYTRTPGH